MCIRDRNSPVRLGVSSATTSPPGFYSQRFWGFLFSSWNPGMYSLSCSPVVPPGLSTCKCGTSPSTKRCLAHPGLPVSALLRVLSTLAARLHLSYWSGRMFPLLTPWLTDFHTVQFSGSSDYLLFFNLLLSFFWLCEETKCIYLCLHLGWKSKKNFF